MTEVREWIGFFEVNADGHPDLERQWIVGDSDEIAEGVRDCLKATPVSRVVFEITRNIDRVEH